MMDFRKRIRDDFERKRSPQTALDPSEDDLKFVERMIKVAAKHNAGLEISHNTGSRPATGPLSCS